MNEEIIDNYILGRMSDEDRQIFERSMSDDPDLKEEVELRKEIVLALRMEQDKEFLQSLEFNIQYQERRRNKTFRIASFAATAACILFGFVLHYDMVYTYKDIGNVITLINPYGLSRGDDNTDVLSDIIEHIENKEFDQALEIIGEQPLDMQQYDSIEWYEAITSMRMGKYLKAKKLLKKIASSNSLYKNDAQNIIDRL